MANPTADDNFWAMFEKAKKEVQQWPEWKQEIQVSIYSETPAISTAPENEKSRSEKK